MKKILVLGGLGFIGTNLIHRWNSSGKDYELTVFDFPGVSSNYSSDVKVVHGDFNNAGDIESILASDRFDIVIHLISTTVPATSNYNMLYDIEANLVASVRLLELMVRHKAQKIVFLSSGGTVYGVTEGGNIDENHPTSPISSHGIIKLSIEKYIQLFNRLYGLDYLILRAGNAYGPFQRSEDQGIINVSLRRIINGLPLVVRGDGSAVRDYFHVNDLADVTGALIDKKISNEILNIGSGTGTSINTLLNIFRELSPSVTVEYKDVLSSDVPGIVLNTSKLRSITDHEFIDLKKGISDTWLHLNSDKVK